jgi:hypothetical protein
MGKKISVYLLRKRNSSLPDSEAARNRAFRVRTIVPALGLLGILLSAPCLARASSSESGNDFYETVGISIAVGTILGASTLPFYREPSSGLLNLAIGAGAGALVGMGIWVVELLTGPSPERARGREHPGQLFLARFEQKTLRISSEYGMDASPRPAFSGFGGTVASVQPALLWMPVVSLTW